jgi:hypothetical protein
MIPELTIRSSSVRVRPAPLWSKLTFWVLPLFGPSYVLAFLHDPRLNSATSLARYL